MIYYLLHLRYESSERSTTTSTWNPREWCRQSTRRTPFYSIFLKEKGIVGDQGETKTYSVTTIARQTDTFLFAVAPPLRTFIFHMTTCLSPRRAELPPITPVTPVIRVPYPYSPRKSSLPICPKPLSYTSGRPVTPLSSPDPRPHWLAKSAAHLNSGQMCSPILHRLHPRAYPRPCPRRSGWLWWLCWSTPSAGLLSLLSSSGPPGIPTRPTKVSMQNE